MSDFYDTDDLESGQARLAHRLYSPGGFLDPFNEEPVWPYQAFNPQSAPLLPPTAAVDPQEEYLEKLYSDLNSLTLEAETIMAEQTRATQRRLSAETKFLFSQYKHFGSMARLSRGIEKFLGVGDEKGTLTFKRESKKNVDGLAADDEGEPAHYGQAFMINYTADDDKYKYEKRTEPRIPGSRISHPLRIVDPESISYVTTLPWDPVGTKLVWPESLQWPKGLLGKINQILSVVDYESRIRLFHYVSKYGPSPVFRAGIAAQVQTHYSSIFETTGSNFLALTPESRVFLRSVYEKHPIVNIAESRMLARLCRIGHETIDLFWGDLSEARKPYEAMKIFVTAKEIEKGRRLKHRDHTFLQQELLRKQREKIFREKEALKQKEAEREAADPQPGDARRTDPGPMGGGMSRDKHRHIDPDYKCGAEAPWA